jgi:hypothetical protein
MRFFLVSFFWFTSILFAAPIDVAKLGQALKSPEGLRGFVHGAVPELHQYVFTFRNPSVMSHMEFSLVAGNPSVAEQLKKLKRNDEIVLKGKYLNNPSPQKHIQVDSLSVIYKHPVRYSLPDRKRTAQIPDELRKANEMEVVVHACVGNGEILVVEYKDTILPVFSPDTELTKDLYRGDRIRLRYTLQSHPKAPTHLRLDLRDKKNAIEVLERIVEINGKNISIEGTLILMPKMQETRFDMFGVQVQQAGGAAINYMLMGEDEKIFAELRKKMQSQWAISAKTIQQGRNCYINPALRVRVRGEGIVGSKNAAAVVVLKSINDLELLP